MLFSTIRIGYCPNDRKFGEDPIDLEEGKRIPDGME